MIKKLNGDTWEYKGWTIKLQMRPEGLLFGLYRADTDKAEWWTETLPEGCEYIDDDEGGTDEPTNPT